MSNNGSESKNYSLSLSNMDPYLQHHLYSGNPFQRLPMPYSQASPYPNFSSPPYGSLLPQRQSISNNALPNIADFTNPQTFLSYANPNSSSTHSSERREGLSEFSSSVSTSAENSRLFPEPVQQNSENSSREALQNTYQFMPQQQGHKLTGHQKTSSIPSMATPPLLPQNSNIIQQPYTSPQHSYQLHQNATQEHSDLLYKTSNSNTKMQHKGYITDDYTNSNTGSPYFLQNRSIQKHHNSLPSYAETKNTSIIAHSSPSKASSHEHVPSKKKKHSKPTVLFRLLGRLEIQDKSEFVGTSNIGVQTDSEADHPEGSGSRNSKGNTSQISEGKIQEQGNETPGKFNVLSAADVDEYQNSEDSSILPNHSTKNTTRSKTVNVPVGGKLLSQSGTSPETRLNLSRIKELETVYSRQIIPNGQSGKTLHIDPDMLASLPISAFKGKDKEAEMERMEINVRIDDSQYVAVGDGPKRWQCNQCSKSYTTKHNLVTHVLDHNGIKPHLCMICGKYFKQLSHLNTHMLTHENVKSNICPVCGKGFTQVSHLKRHQAVHQDSKPHVCDICNRGFAYPSELRLHKAKHVPGKDNCIDCDENFESPKQLKEHMVKHDTKEDHECPECHRLFRYPSQLKDHLSSHSGYRPFICSECGMDFIKEHHLKAHQFTHTGLRPYECQVCNRTFNQRANMIRHQLIHSNERSYKCNQCDKTFTQPQTLKAHMVVHADKKPHQCKICKKEFGRFHNLQAHMHMHTDSKPFLCFCGSSFTLKGNLKRHKKVKHGIDECTETMEEEAVWFLSTMSNRSAQNVDAPLDMSQDSDSPDSPQTQDSKAQRKQRKSIPRKIPQNSGDSGDEEYEEEAEEVKEDSNDREPNISVSRFFRALTQPVGNTSGKLMAMKRSYAEMEDSDTDDMADEKNSVRKTSRCYDDEDESKDDDDESKDETFDEEEDEDGEVDENDEDWIPGKAEKLGSEKR